MPPIEIVEYGFAFGIGALLVLGGMFVAILLAAWCAKKLGLDP